METSRQPSQNRLLAALPEAELARLAPHLELVHLTLGEILYEPGRRLTYLYFPIDCIISTLYVLQNGQTGEVAVVGNAGVAGVALILGGEAMPGEAMVQHAGDAWRLPGSVMSAEFQHAQELRAVLLRYVQALLTQIGQTAICNRHHTVEQQLCRWLLLSLDRLPTNEIHMTQELIAHMLGVRREGVTVAALGLQQDGLISYARGHIVVLDRPGLEARACECYAVVKREYDRLLAQPN